MGSQGCRQMSRKIRRWRWALGLRALVLLAEVGRSMVELVTKEEEESGAERSGRSQSVAVEEDGRTASLTMIKISAVGQLINTSQSSTAASQR